MAEHHATPLLEVRKLTKVFGGLHALDGVDLVVPVGRVVGLIGPNGSGKTTLFNIVTGILRPTSGKILFNGRDITGSPPHVTCRLGIARTFQQIRLFSGLSVVDNVVAGLVDRRSTRAADWLRASWRHEGRALELLAIVGLADLADNQAGSLPYGNQRRLEVARALATDPKLLLLDEPLAGMNPAEIEDFIDLVKRINQSGIGILLIEHNVGAVMRCCLRTHVFDYGRKIAEGTASELLCDDAVIKAYLGEELVEHTTAELLGSDVVAMAGERGDAAG
jgi:branched-chain amino acid transport system ATP-binding protein